MLKVDTACLETQAQRMNEIARQLDAISSRVADVNRQLRWNTSINTAIRNSLVSNYNNMSRLDDITSELSRALSSAAIQYSKAEDASKNSAGAESVQIVYAGSPLSELVDQYKPVVIDGKTDSFWDEFRSEYGWKEILNGAGYIGTIYDFIEDIKNGKTWRDFAKVGVDAYQFLSGAAKTYRNYKQIGNAVGTKTAMAWWAKSITGLKPLGRASSAQNPFTRFANNLTNKTSPFNAQFKNVVDNFKGTNGAGKAVASWGAVAVNGVLNWFSNKDEQANSDGAMSDGRVWAETITETAVDMALTYGAGIVVGAAVTAAFGTVAAPGIVVVAAGGAIIAGINAGVKALTGDTVTEVISDAILDTGKAIGDAAKKAKKAIGNWFKKLSFA